LQAPTVGTPTVAARSSAIRFPEEKPPAVARLVKTFGDLARPTPLIGGAVRALVAHLIG
jgi:hypothetical protein